MTLRGLIPWILVLAAILSAAGSAAKEDRYSENETVAPEFDESLYNGARFLAWRALHVDGRLQKLMHTAEDIVLPEKTRYINVRPPLISQDGDPQAGSAQPVSTGVVKRLTHEEKLRLPQNVLKAIGAQMSEVQDLENSPAGFEVYAYAEFYDGGLGATSAFERSRDDSVILIARIKDRDLPEEEASKSIRSNVYFNAPYFYSGVFVRFVRDADGQYEIQFSGSAN